MVIINVAGLAGNIRKPKNAYLRQIFSKEVVPANVNTDFAHPFLLY